MGTMIEDCDMDPAIFLNYSTLVIGESGSGKTTIFDDLIYRLCPFVSEVHIISPSERTTDKPLLSKRVRKPFMHYQLSFDLMLSLWQRAEKKTTAAKIGSDMTHLLTLFNKLCTIVDLGKIKDALRATEIKKSELINNALEQFKDENVQKEHIGEIEEKFKEIKIKAYKKYINRHRAKFSLLDLSREEECCLRLMNFNPNTLILLDDSSSDIKSKTKEMMKLLSDYIFRGRHNHITFIVSVHDDKLFDTELRKNAHNTIYTSPTAAISYYNKASNSFSNDIKKYVREIVKFVFGDSSDTTTDKKICPHKILYRRLIDKFFRFTAVMRRNDNYRFRNEAIDRFCDQIEIGDGDIDKAAFAYNEFLQ